jgi:hypothetical protein
MIEVFSERTRAGSAALATDSAAAARRSQFPGSGLSGLEVLPVKGRHLVQVRSGRFGRLFDEWLQMMPPTALVPSAARWAKVPCGLLAGFRP